MAVIYTESPHLIATNQEIQKLMDKLGCSRKEAIDIIKEDKEIDKMSVKEAYSDLTDEQRKATKAATITGSKKKVAVKRERKIDEDKKFLITYLLTRILSITDNPNEVKRDNENEIHFTFNHSNFTIKLIKHRPQK